MLNTTAILTFIYCIVDNIVNMHPKHPRSGVCPSSTDGLENSPSYEDIYQYLLIKLGEYLYLVKFTIIDSICIKIISNPSKIPARTKDGFLVRIHLMITAFVPAAYMNLPLNPHCLNHIRHKYK